MQARDAAAAVCRRFAEAVRSESEFRGEVTLVVEAASLREICLFCRDELSFDYLVDISSVDHFGEEPRFEVVYELSSLAHGAHLRLKAAVSEDDCAVDSVTGVWPTADWHEREVWDMMGIRFRDHPDLRRILMWEGYPYHPLRKDFPLEGRPSEVPGLAFSDRAPLAGGPFVSLPADTTTIAREPRARPSESSEPAAPAPLPELP